MVGRVGREWLKEYGEKGRRSKERMERGGSVREGQGREGGEKCRKNRENGKEREAKRNKGKHISIRINFDLKNTSLVYFSAYLCLQIFAIGLCTYDATFFLNFQVKLFLSVQIK